MVNIALFGPPGAGKGTQSEFLIEKYKLFYISTGDLLRKELAEKTNQLLTAFLDEWFSRYGDGFVAHYPEYYMPSGITLSEDEIGSVNEEMFVEFFLPHLTELSNRYGGIGIHCCATARHQWENLAKIPNLRLLNLVQEEDVLRDAYKFFATKTTQMHSWPGTGDAWTFPEMYPADSRVVITVWSDDKDETIDVTAKLREVCGR